MKKKPLRELIKEYGVIMYHARLASFGKTDLQIDRADELFAEITKTIEAE